MQLFKKNLALDTFSSAIKTLRTAIILLNYQVPHSPDKTGLVGLFQSFWIVAQLLAYRIKTCAVKGISLLGKELIITHLANDTTLIKKKMKAKSL